MKTVMRKASNFVKAKPPGFRILQCHSSQTVDEKAHRERGGSETEPHNHSTLNGEGVPMLLN